MKYKVEYSTVIDIEAKNDDDASEKRYAILERLMDTLILDEELHGFVEYSTWIHSDPKKV